MQCQPLRRPRSAFMIFAQQRRLNNDHFKTLAFTESLHALNREWNAMFTADRQQFLDEAAVERARWHASGRHKAQ
jgi:hypothetical protein